MPLVDQGVLDQVVVVDDSGTDGRRCASRRRRGPCAGGPLPRVRAVRGEGDALWRALTVLPATWCASWTPTPRTSGPISPAGWWGRWSAATARTSPRLLPPPVPGRRRGAGRGRRAGTELTANRCSGGLAELAGCLQPLAGEVAARRELLLELPFVTGYGVDIALLIDAWRRPGDRPHGPGGPGRCQNAHQPSSTWVRWPPRCSGRYSSRVDGAAEEVERPPMASVHRRGRATSGAGGVSGCAARRSAGPCPCRSGPRCPVRGA